MAQVIRYIVLALVLVFLGWKAFTILVPKEEPKPAVLMVGDDESAITGFYGKPLGVSDQSGMTSYYFSSAEIDAEDGVVVAIRDKTKVTGTLQMGERELVIDGQNQIGER